MRTPESPDTTTSKSRLGCRVRRCSADQDIGCMVAHNWRSSSSQFPYNNSLSRCFTAASFGSFAARVAFVDDQFRLTDCLNVIEVEDALRLAVGGCRSASHARFRLVSIVN